MAGNFALIRKLDIIENELELEKKRIDQHTADKIEELIQEKRRLQNTENNSENYNLIAVNSAYQQELGLY